MSKQILLTLFLFVVALASGIFIGMSIARPHGRPPQERSWLADELQLSPEQREQMRAIWSAVVRGPGGGHGDRRRQAARQRDEAIAALITPEQKPAYDKVQEQYNQQLAEMSREREAALQKAVEQTKAILNPQQRARYETMLEKGDFRPGRDRDRERSRPATGRAAASQPQDEP